MILFGELRLITESAEQNFEAFTWLDEYFTLSWEDFSPDEALDWIYMMPDHDWILLEVAWHHRSSNWQESRVYILGQGPVPESLSLLQKALFSENLAVAIEAACWFSQQCLEHGEDVSIDERMITRLRVLVDIAKTNHLEEVVHLLEQVGLD
jgi:hypothetical protein